MAKQRNYIFSKTKMPMLNRKKYDLLTLEKFLASNSDIILIVCESPGSFTELGAFVNNSETLLI